MRFQTRIQGATLSFSDGRKTTKIRDSKGVFVAKPRIRTVQLYSESIVYVGAKVWDLIPENIKMVQ